MSRIFTLLCLLLLTINIQSKAQNETPSSQELFEKALTLYFEGVETINNEEIDLLFDDWDSYFYDASDLFNQINDNGDLGKSSLYYQLLCYYQLANGDYNFELDSIFCDEGNKLLTRFDRFNASMFPFYYTYKGARYVVNVEKLEWFRNDLCNKLFIAASRMKNYPDALKYARAAYSLSSNTKTSRLQALLFIGVAKEELNQFDQELAENGILFIETFNSLTEEEKNSVSAWISHTTTAEVGWDEFNQAANNIPAIKENGDLTFRLASGLRKLNSPNTADAYRLALASKKLSNIQLFEVADYATSSKDIMAITAADLLLEQSLNCNDYSRLETIYLAMGESGKAKQAANKKDECNKKVARDIKRSHTTPFRIFAGIHPGQYLRDIEQRDPGAVIGFMKGKRMTALSFSKVVNDPYQMLDLYLNDITIPGFHPKWDGYRAGIAFRKSFENFENKKWNYYHGVQLSYARMNLQPFSDEITNLETLEKNTTTFNPIDHSYRAYYNIGTTWYWYFIGFDLNINLGLSLNTFDLNHSDYSYKGNYSFANPLLEFRKDKEFHYGSLIQINFVTYLTL